jgi:hypothetical protein
MLAVCELGGVSEWFWTSVPPLENRSSSIYLLGYKDKMS